MPKLTPKQRAFVREFAVDLNATQAAVRAGYSPRSAKSIGDQNLRKPAIAAELAKQQKARAERLDITADDVVERYWAIATANPNELARVRVSACRYCHGQDHSYQWIDENEYHSEHARWAAQPEPVTPEPTDAGGYGYHLDQPPHPRCPACLGDGKTDVVLADTSNLSPAALALYSGAKVTQAGFVITMHDQMKALEMVGRRLGLFNDRTTSINIDFDKLTDEQLERIAAGEDPLTVARSTE